MSLPTASIPQGSWKFANCWKHWQEKKGVTIFMSSHILTEVDRLATRIGVIHQGRLIEELDADQLETLRTKRLEVRARNIEAAQLSLKNEGYKYTVADGMIVLDEERAFAYPDPIAQILVHAGALPTHLAVRQQNLEEHFMQITRATS